MPPFPILVGKHWEAKGVPESSRDVLSPFLWCLPSLRLLSWSSLPFVQGIVSSLREGEGEGVRSQRPLQREPERGRQNDGGLKRFLSWGQSLRTEGRGDRGPGHLMSPNGICSSLPQGQVRGGMGPARLDEAQGRGE